MSNLNLNKVVLAGRLTAEPELKQTNTGIPVVSVNLAVNRRRARTGDQNEQQTDFITIVCLQQSLQDVFIHLQLQ